MSSACAALPAPERVRFASLDAAGGNGVEVEALYYRPAGAVPDGGRPAVIALHGCSGLFGTSRDTQAELPGRHRARAEAMLAAGYAVLFPDSLGSRGMNELCTTKVSERTLTAAGRRGDALGALRWLAAQPGAAPGKGVRVGPDPAARVDANRRVDAFLRDELGR